MSVSTVSRGAACISSSRSLHWPVKVDTNPISAFACKSQIIVLSVTEAESSLACCRKADIFQQISVPTGISKTGKCPERCDTLYCHVWLNFVIIRHLLLRIVQMGISFLLYFYFCDWPLPLNKQYLSHKPKASINKDKIFTNSPIWWLSLLMISM